MKKHLSILTVCLIGVAAFAKNPEPSFRNIVYGKHSRNTLDLWEASGESPRPLLIYIHGGAWVSNTKDQIYGRVPIADWLAKGVSVASVDYRFSTDAKLPAPVHDAARAIQFLRSKAGVYNIDPLRMALQGGSAGGCSALWILFHDDMADPLSSDPVFRQSTRVQGAYVQSAQTAIDPVLLKDWIGAGAAEHGMIVKGVGALSSYDLVRDRERYGALLDEFSPINHLDAGDPPVFLEYSADISLPPSSPSKAIHHGMFGIELKEKAERVGYTRCFLSIPGTESPGDWSGPTEFLEFVLMPDGK